MMHTKCAQLMLQDLCIQVVLKPHLPIVQIMPVFLAVIGGESISRRHICSRNVSAMAACSCWVWMKAVPASWCLDMVAEVSYLNRSKTWYEGTCSQTKCPSWTSAWQYPMLILAIINPCYWLVFRAPGEQWEG